jgi:hypothetical protein
MLWNVDVRFVLAGHTPIVGTSALCQQLPFAPMKTGERARSPTGQQNSRLENPQATLAALLRSRHQLTRALPATCHCPCWFISCLLKLPERHVFRNQNFPKYVEVAVYFFGGRSPATRPIQHAAAKVLTGQRFPEAVFPEAGSPRHKN